MTWTIRRATSADGAALSRFAIDSFTETYAGYNTPEDMADYVARHFSESEVQRLLSDHGTAILVIDHDGIVGYMQITLGEIPEIDRFYVASSLHGTGAAQALMRETTELVRASGAKVLQLGVWEKNARAIAFYRKAGFEKIGEQTFTLGSDKQNDWVMRLRL